MKAKLLFLYLLFHFISQAQNDSLATAQFENYSNIASSYLYKNQDSAYLYFNKALHITNNQKWYDYKANVLFYLVYVSDYHYNLPVLKNNIDSLEVLLNNHKNYLSKDVYKTVLPLFQLNKGNYYYKLADYKRAKPYFLELYKTLKSSSISQENIRNLESVYSFLTIIYSVEGKYELAEDFCDRAKLLIEKHTSFFEDPDSKKILLNSYLAKIYNSQKQYKKGIPLLEESVVFYQKRQYKNSLITSYQALINAYILSNNTTEAVQLLKNSENLYRKKDPFYKVLQELYGDIYLKDKKFEEAINSYNASLISYKSYRNNKKHIDIALLYKKMAVTYLASNQIEKALVHIQKSIQNLTFSENKTEDLSVKEFFITDKSISILHLKSKILTKLHEQTNDQNYLEKALKTSLFAITVLDVLKPTLENKNDKQFLINNIYSLFEDSLNVSFNLFNITKNKEYLNHAFFILEKSKSTQLLEAVNLTKAVKFNNIPQQLIDREQQLASKVSQLETNIYTSNTSLEEKTALIKAREVYVSFLDSIKKAQPKYHNLKYNYNVISLEKASEKLQENQGKIAFFYGKKHIYQFAITNAEVHFFRFKNHSNFQKEILEFYEIISNFKGKYDTKKAYNLYQKLIPETLKNKSDLVILPDGFLHYIPFEALCTQPLKKTYLVNETMISYGSSFTLLDELETIQHHLKEKKLLAVAPEFYKKSVTKNNRADFSPLIFNEKEVNNITNYFETDHFIGKNAVLNNIKAKINDYQILHFATHASANDEYPDFSYLAFTPTENESNLWYVKDIYNTTLNADLVTLSACQTGIGKLENGEGSISLARAFSFAGAKSLVKSLWKVNDKSSSQIMTLFYKELSNGINKKLALQRAKNQYLKQQTVKELKHPFFWAGFVLNGDSKPVTTSSYNYLWFYFTIGLLIILFINRKKLVQLFK